MSKKRNRKHSKIDNLPSTLKEAVDLMLMGNSTYREVADFIRDNTGNTISETSVWRYATSLDATVQELRLAQQNIRVVMEEAAKYPNLDTSEGILRLLSHRVLEAVRNLDAEKMEALDPLELIGAAQSLIKVSAYKASADSKLKDIKDIGFDATQEMVFETMAKEDPELYARIRQFLNNKRGAE